MMIERSQQRIVECTQCSRLLSARVVIDNEDWKSKGECPDCGNDGFVSVRLTESNPEIHVVVPCCSAS
jgi:hypothetical protein